MANQYKVTRFGQPQGVTNVTVGDYFVYTGHRDDFTLCSEPCYDQNQVWQEEGVACVPGTILKVAESYPTRRFGMNYVLRGVYTPFERHVGNLMLTNMINADQFGKSQLRKVPQTLHQHAFGRKSDRRNTRI